MYVEDKLNEQITEILELAEIDIKSSFKLKKGFF